MNKFLGLQLAIISIFCAVEISCAAQPADRFLILSPNEDFPGIEVKLPTPRTPEQIAAYNSCNATNFVPGGQYLALPQGSITQNRRGKVPPRGQVPSQAPVYQSCVRSNPAQQSGDNIAEVIDCAIRVVVAICSWCTCQR